MKRTLRSSKSSKNQQTYEELSRQFQNADPAQVESMRNVVAQYQNKSEAELMQELRAARAQGEIRPDDLANVAQQLAPYLSPEQQRRLSQVMNQLK